MKLQKILLKVVNEEEDKVEWAHLCYIEGDLYQKFLEEMSVLSTDMNEIIARWVKEDFRVDLTMTRKRDIFIFKEMVKNQCKDAYPMIYMESSTDRQGWIRVWITRKMKEDLGIDRRE